MDEIEESMKKEPECLQSDMESLIEHYGNIILRFCYLYLLDLDEAQQAVQDVFVRLYNDREFQSQRLDEKILLRVVVQQCRRRNLQGKRYQCDLTDPLLILLKSMSPLDREILLLVFYIGMQISDTAQICAIPSFIVRYSISKVSQCFKEDFKNNQKK